MLTLERTPLIWFSEHVLRPLLISSNMRRVCAVTSLGWAWRTKLMSFALGVEEVEMQTVELGARERD